MKFFIEILYETNKSRLEMTNGDILGYSISDVKNGYSACTYFSFHQFTNYFHCNSYLSYIIMFSLLLVLSSLDSTDNKVVFKLRRVVFVTLRRVIFVTLCRVFFQFLCY